MTTGTPKLLSYAAITKAKEEKMNTFINPYHVTMAKAPVYHRTWFKENLHNNDDYFRILKPT